MRYDYKCAKQHITTLDAPMGEQPDVTDCEICGEPARRVYTAPAIHMRVYNHRETSPATENHIGAQAYM